MGALHAGHLSLIRAARKRAGRRGSVVASIFVNPAQFGPLEDLSRYPRPFARDTRLCKENGVDLLFHPARAQIYLRAHSTWVEEETLSRALCGKSRPGHFRGVCTVVASLFHIVQPQVALFGAKDWQQAAIIRRMVRDLHFDIQIETVATVREPDGLALSSRNQYLTSEQRTQAPLLRSALLHGARLWKEGRRSPLLIRRQLIKILSKASTASVDYVEVVDPRSLQPAAPGCRRALIAAAVFFGQTRLIDNILLGNR